MVAVEVDQLTDSLLTQFSLVQSRWLVARVHSYLAALMAMSHNPSTNPFRLKNEIVKSIISKRTTENLQYVIVVTR